MSATFFGYFLDWAGLLLRWSHLVVGIAWIGSSFYFVWLDNHLRPPREPALAQKGVAGELWAVHGGGFYNPQKYLVAPASLPAELHWFKWEAYSTWLTGMFLLVTVYYLQASTWMLDPAAISAGSSTASSALPALSPGVSIIVGLASLALGWFFYNWLCAVFEQRSQIAFGACYFAFVVAMTWLLTHLLSGRAAFVHVGAMIGTTMVANVFFRIIPGQKIMVAQMQRGEAPDPIHGIRGKQRSVHNNYLTLPVLFCMISNHYAFLYGHAYSWAGLSLILLAACLIRHFFNQRHWGRAQWRYPLAGAALLLAVAFWFAPSSALFAGSEDVPFARVEQVVDARCVPCHAEHPKLLPAAPLGVMLDTPERVHALRQRIWQQAVQARTMPLGNATNITEEERALLDRWGRASGE